MGALEELGGSRSCPVPEVEPGGRAPQRGHLAKVLPRPLLLVEEGGGWEPGSWPTGFGVLVGGGEGSILAFGPDFPTPAWEV